MNINMINIGKRVNEIRNDLNLSREKFGSEIGIKGDVIYNIEAARNKNFNEPVLIALCSKYGINKEWLLYGKGEKYIKTKESLIDELVNTYNLSFYGEQIIRTYLNLPNNKKVIIDDFIEELTKNCSVDKTLVAARGNAELEIVSDDEAVRKDIENYIPPNNL